MWLRIFFKAELICNVTSELSEKVFSSDSCSLLLASWHHVLFVLTAVRANACSDCCSGHTLRRCHQKVCFCSILLSGIFTFEMHMIHAEGFLTDSFESAGLWDFSNFEFESLRAEFLHTSSCHLVCIHFQQPQCPFLCLLIVNASASMFPFYWRI